MNVKLTFNDQEKALQQRLARISEWAVPQATKDQLHAFFDALALGKVNVGKRLKPNAILKYCSNLRVPLEFFQKETQLLTGADIESFERALSSNTIKSSFKQKPYALTSKVDIRLALKIYLRWCLGAEQGRQLAGWLDTRDVPKTPDYLHESDIEALYKACKSAHERFLIAVLFDSGARAEEFHNIRFEDVQLPQGQHQFVRLTLKQEYSKTLGRVISLYWKHSHEAVREFLQQRLREGIRAKDPIYNFTYNSGRFFLARLAEKVLGRHVHYHLFRHSSATYYASRMNRQELCIRYGWKFSSDMPDVYISRAGMENSQLDEKFRQTQISILREELVEKQLQEKLSAQRIEELQKKMGEMENRFAQVARVLSLHPSIEQLEDAIVRAKQRAREQNG